MGSSFFTNETYARGDQAYVAAVVAQQAADSAAQAAADAMATASGAEDGLITTFFQTSAPTGQTNGDLWFDTDDNNKLYRWQGDYGNVARTNYCPNPSAQYSSTGWSAIRGTLSTDASVLLDDRATWKVLINDLSTVGDLAQALQWNSRSVAVTAGQTWTMSGYARSSTLSAITQYKARIVWLNASNAVVSTTEGLVFTSSASDRWIKVSVTGTVPATATKFDFIIGAYDGGELNVSDAFWVGDIVWEQGTETGAFFAGSMPNAAWTGTVGNSSSTFTPAWVEASDQRGAQALINASAAQTTANRKVATYFRASTSAPVAPAEGFGQGDIWVKTDLDNAIFYWTGTPGAWTAAPIGTNALSAPIASSLSQNFIDDMRTTTAWTKLGGAGSLSTVSVTDSQIGGSAMQATGVVTTVGPLLPYDPNRLYRLVARMRTSSATPTFTYVGVAGVAADGVTYVNISGLATTSQQHYVAASNATLAVGPAWTTYTGYFKGTAATGGTGAATDPNAPRALHQNVRFVRPIMYLNYTGAAGDIQQIDSFRIEVVNDDVLAVANSAQTAANGKNKIFYQNTLPGTTSNAAGDVWYQFSGTGQLIGMWIGQGGTSWQIQAIQDTVLGNINASKLTAYSLGVQQIALGVLRSNPINNSGYEETFTPTKFSAAGQGDPTQWRFEISDNTNVKTVTDFPTGYSHSGAISARTYIKTGSATTDYADLYTCAFRVIAGASYKVRWSAAATGTGCGVDGTTPTIPRLYVDALFGTTQSTVGTTVSQNLASTTDYGYYGVPRIWDVDVNNNPVASYVSTINSSSFTDFSVQMDIPLGQTELWCVIRFRNTQNPPEVAIFIDDASVIQMNAGGGMEITAGGLRLFDNDGEEVAAFVSNRPSVLNVVDKGNTVAVVAQTGDASFLSVSSDTDLYVSGTPAYGRLGSVHGARDFNTNWDTTRDYSIEPVAVVESASLGHVGYYSSSNVPGTAINASGGYVMLGQVNADLELGRMYAFRTGQYLATVPTGVTCAMIIRWTTNSTDPTPSSAIFARCYHTGSGGYESFQIAYRPVAGINTQRDVRFMCQVLHVGGTGAITPYPSDPFFMVVEDMGYGIPPGTGTLINTTVQAAGTPPTTTSTKTYVSSWIANNTQTRRGVSSYGNYTINPTTYTGSTSMLAGYYSSSNGNQFALLEFTAANSTGSETGKTISTALSGATVSKVEIYVKNSSFYGSAGGSMRFGATALTANTTTTTLSPPSTTYTANQGFTPGQGKWVTLPTAANTTVKNGGRVLIVGPGSSNSTYYYSKWANHAASTGKPQIRITYTR